MIDANLNRSSEGLRVLEDAARFLLNDAELTRRLRTLRHDLARETKSLRVGLLSGRDADHDVGHFHSKDKELARGATSLPSVLDLVTANAKRVEEALRVMEELAKLPEINSLLNSADLEQTRFALYALERDLFSKILRRDKTDRIIGLYVILDRQFLAGRNELEVVKQIIDGGAKVVQLRDKQSKRRELVLLAQKLKELCSQAGALFIVNDCLDVALAVDADGLHIGQEDFPLHVARKELPIDRIVGCSVKTPVQAKRVQDDGADYVAVGSVFPTTTKKEAITVGVETVREVKRTISIPLVAIGGINDSNIGEVVAAGADAVAVVSAVLGEKDAKEAVHRLVKEMDLAREKCRTQ
jgi:thiamine-phosphate pyrophosphorylase